MFSSRPAASPAASSAVAPGINTAMVSGLWRPSMAWGGKIFAASAAREPIRASAPDPAAGLAQTFQTFDAHQDPGHGFVHGAELVQNLGQGQAGDQAGLLVHGRLEPLGADGHLAHRAILGLGRFGPGRRVQHHQTVSWPGRTGRIGHGLHQGR